MNWLAQWLRSRRVKSRQKQVVKCWMYALRFDGMTLAQIEEEVYGDIVAFAPDMPPPEGIVYVEAGIVTEAPTQEQWQAAMKPAENIMEESPLSRETLAAEAAFRGEAALVRSEQAVKK